MLKADRGDQILRVEAEEFDQISRVISYGGWGVLSKLT